METRIANQDARSAVESLQEFKGSNTFGRVLSDRCYVVYSYGEHFPIYAYINGQWYGNKDKYSQTTSRHQSQLRPNVAKIYVVSTEELQANIAAA